MIASVISCRTGRICAQWRKQGKTETQSREKPGLVSRSGRDAEGGGVGGRPQSLTVAAVSGLTAAKDRSKEMARSAECLSDLKHPHKNLAG